MSSQFKEKIDRLIINFPFKEPSQHWEFEKTNGKFFIKEGRRSAGYVHCFPKSNSSGIWSFCGVPPL